jgi:hypothetical protein
MGPMSETGQSRHSDGGPSISGLRQLADIFSTHRHISNVPDSDIEAKNAKDIFGQAIRPPSGVARADR